MRRSLAVVVVLVAVGCRAETHPAESATTSSPAPSRPPFAPETTPSSSPSSASSASSSRTPSAAVSSRAATTGDAPGTWSFDGDNPDAPPAGFAFGRTGTGRLGTWVVRAEPDAPSAPNVLAQLDTDPTDDRFAVAVVDDASFRDVALSVRCKPMAGRVDQACGLVLRHRDENNYYLARANALENNVGLYVVEGGRRRPIASWRGTVAAKQWHVLAFDARASHFQVTWDGTKVIERDDETFRDAGRVGLWTKADSVTWFDDLKARAL